MSINLRERSGARRGEGDGHETGALLSGRSGRQACLSIPSSPGELNVVDGA